MNLRVLYFVCFAALFSLQSQWLDASVIVAWDVDGVDVDSGLGGASNTSPYTFSATSSDLNASGQLTLGSGVNPSTARDQYGFKITTADTQTDLTGAITSNHYLEFSINVDPGFELNLNQIELNGDTSSTGADDVALLSSIGGFASNPENVIASLSDRQGAGTGSLDTDGSGFSAPIDLSDSQFQGLTGTVLFRVYGFNTGGSNGSTFIRNLAGDDLIVDGTLIATAVPEPTTLVMFGSALLGLGFRRRRLIKT